MSSEEIIPRGADHELVAPAPGHNGTEPHDPAFEENNPTQNRDNTMDSTSRQATMASCEVSLIGFIGAGNLARILMKTFISTGLFGPNDIIASDINPGTLKLSEELEVNTTVSNTQVVQSCNVVVIAVEPGQVPAVLQEIREDITEGHLLISVAAGVTIDQITQCLVSPESDAVVSDCENNWRKPRIVRVMTNTPTSVQAGVSVYSLGKYTTERDSNLTRTLFSSVGICEMLAERFMDAVTGVSGSGPAYAFTIIEALSDGGVKMGLSRNIATKFAAQTLMGAAKMVLETGKHPAELKDMVTSPGGTTIAALHELEKAGLRASLINAVQAATKRSKQLGTK